jgi:GT2 family glycosyltransferase
LDFGPKGLKYPVGEDTELHYRASRLGINAWYDPALMVQHHTSTERMSIHRLMRRSWQNAQAKALIFFPDLAARDNRSPVRSAFSCSAITFKTTISLLFACFLLIWRNRRTYPYWQNYIVERINPQISRISMNLRLAGLFANQRGSK